MTENRVNGHSPPTAAKAVTGELITPKPGTVIPSQSTALAMQQQQALMLKQAQDMQQIMQTNLITNLVGQVMESMNQLSELRSQFSEGGQYFCDEFEWHFSIEEN